MSSTELISGRGYPVETHVVTTPDGYLLELHRIPSSPKAGNATAPHRTPLLLAHGMGSSDEQWLVPTPNLAFILADHGYDVWLTNYRGSFYGRRHTSINPKSPEFWDFSWHENGVIDQPAMMDYVLEVTKRPKLVMIGHSMSTTAQIVLLAERPEYADKVLAGVYLAPTVYFRHPVGMMDFLRALAKTFPSLKTAYSRYVSNNPMPGMDHGLFKSCHPLTRRGKARPVCRFFIEWGGGAPHQPEDLDLMLRMMGHYPTGASIRQVMHYFQGITSGEFRQYDYGAQRNRQIYGSRLPPRYNLTNVRAPTYLYYSVSDGLVSMLDVEELVENLPSVKVLELHKVGGNQFSHLDYILASEDSDLYQSILKSLDKYTR
ncbi:lipase 1-like [Thrips palmi]|uniref:Lipase n=1 Tax=Thrips palmi TaxID=161013 RepID=A0A6P8Z186_THRPL|nr:lipase 1-like [Thrips palmi]